MTIENTGNPGSFAQPKVHGTFPRTQKVSSDSIADAPPSNTRSRQDYVNTPKLNTRTATDPPIDMKIHQTHLTIQMFSTTDIQSHLQK